MTPENFVYWLQGYFELCEIGEKEETYYPEIKGDQVKVIRDHLRLVLDKKTPTHTISVPSMSGKNSEISPDLVDKLSQILHSNSVGGDISVCSNIDLSHTHIPVTC